MNAVQCLFCACVFGSMMRYLQCSANATPSTLWHKLNMFQLLYRQEELMAIMKDLGYTAVVQDRSKSKFTICNATFFRSNKLCHTWTESRSRALVTGFKLIPDMEFAADLASGTPACTRGEPVDGASDVRRAGTSTRGGGMATLAAVTPETPGKVNGAAVKDGQNPTDSGEGLTTSPVTGAAEVFVANCHLEGHPWKSQERFNQIKGVLTRMERRQTEAGAPMDDARILVVGVCRLLHSHAHIFAACTVASARAFVLVPLSVFFC